MIRGLCIDFHVLKNTSHTQRNVMWLTFKGSTDEALWEANCAKGGNKLDPFKVILE